MCHGRAGRVEIHWYRVGQIARDWTRYGSDTARLVEMTLVVHLQARLALGQMAAKGFTTGQLPFADASASASSRLLSSSPRRTILGHVLLVVAFRLLQVGLEATDLASKVDYVLGKIGSLLRRAETERGTGRKAGGAQEAV